MFSHVLNPAYIFASLPSKHGIFNVLKYALLYRCKISKTCYNFIKQRSITMKTKIQWYPAFAAAMGLELIQNRNDLIYEKNIT